VGYGSGGYGGERGNEKLADVAQRHCVGSLERRNDRAEGAETAVLL
jgi:hypothetical protein